MASYLSSLVPVIAIIATIVGLCCALLCNASSCPLRVYWGRRLYLLIFLLLAFSCFGMALLWPRGVLPSCLSIGTLFLGMLWQPTTPVEEMD